MSGNFPSLAETSLIRIIQSIRDLYMGRNNATGRVTLAVAPATTTVVSGINCGGGAEPVLTPRTANAAAAQATGQVYISAVGQGTFTITHPASAQTDRTFGYVALG